MDQPAIKAGRGKSYFWPVQAGSWLLFGLVNIFIHRLHPPPPSIELLNTITISLGGFAVTSAYRILLKRRLALMPVRTGRFLLFVFTSSAVIAAIWFVLAVLIFLPFFNRYSLTLLSLLPGAINFYIIIISWNLLYLGYQIIKKYHTAEVEKWQLAAEVQKAQLGALKAQINPHFMFNALNNIRALILEDKEAARTMLTQFADILRYSLQFAELREVALSEELNMLSQYVDLLRIQYEHRLSFEQDINDAVLHHKVPPMILQLLAENAMKHGIARLPDGGRILVIIDGTENTLRLMVRNTRASQENDHLEESLGVGLANISKRLQLLYGNNAALHLTEDDEMVTVTINIAYK